MFNFRDDEKYLDLDLELDLELDEKCFNFKKECFYRYLDLKKCGDFELLQLWRVGLTINDVTHFVGGVGFVPSLHMDSWLLSWVSRWRGPEH